MSQKVIYVVDAVLWIIAIMGVRSREVHWGYMLVMSIGGFLLAFTPMGYPVWFALDSIGKLLLG